MSAPWGTKRETEEAREGHAGTGAFTHQNVLALHERSCFVDIYVRLAQGAAAAGTSFMNQINPYLLAAGIYIPLKTR